MRRPKTPTRTLSGVAPIAVMLPPRACKHGSCIYCPQLEAPQSYTPESPAVIRAKKSNYNSYEQVKKRLIELKNMGHPTDKVEIIIMGGTFLSYPIKFQYKFVKGCYDALNGKISKNLEKAKMFNESAKSKCVALCIETRPDFCSNKEIKRMLEFGCTRVELGVQAIDDKIYEITNRGHKVKDVIEATKRLKNKGFKVGYHLMLGLPGSNKEKDLLLFRRVFTDSRFRPDQIKIYPCQVIKGSKLEKIFNSKKFMPYNREDIYDLMLKIFPDIPRYCRVMRIMREIPLNYLVAGSKDMGMRGRLEKEMREKNFKVKEIRFREFGIAYRDRKKIDLKTKIKKFEYVASGGEEIFLETVNNEDILFGLLRMRLNNKKIKEAFIRELHVYGSLVEIGKKSKEKIQHRGIGKSLLRKAEKIALEKGVKKIKIISGVGVRGYYRKLGYSLDKEGYMVKLIKFRKEQKDHA